MSFNPLIGSLEGVWTYRSFINNPAVDTDFDKLEFGRGTIEIRRAPQGTFQGRIYGPGWELALNGSTNQGNPAGVRFQGRGMVGGEEWVYDYIGYLSPPWPNGIEQRPALAGSIVRTVPHADGAGGIAPAGVVCSWYAVMATAGA